MHFSFFPLLILLPIITRCIPKLGSKIAPLKDYLFWNGTIRMFMEAYLEFCIFSMMNIRELKWIENQTTISVNNFLCLFMIALVVLIPFVLFMIMWRNRKKWNDSLFGKQYGTYLGGMAKEGSKGQLVILIAVSVFFVRRAIMSFTIVFWTEFLLGQIAI